MACYPINDWEGALEKRMPHWSAYVVASGARGRCASVLLVLYGGCILLSCGWYREYQMRTYLVISWPPPRIDSFSVRPGLECTC